MEPATARKSINKQLATYAAHQVTNETVTVLDLNAFEMPIYSIDREQASGIPQLAHDFRSELAAADGIVISFAEHNGAYSAAFKNIFDWISRIEGEDVWQDKPLFLLATSPGGRGGQTVLEIAVNKMQRMTKVGLAHFSLPAFQSNFTEHEGITDQALKASFNEALQQFEALLAQ